MHVLTVTFGLSATGAGETPAVADLGAHHLAGLPGLVSKLWMDSPATGTYGWVYLWESRAALEAYLTSRAFRALLNDPALVDVTATAFDTVAAPAEYTALPLAGAAA